MAITIFVSYSHLDEAFRAQLDKHFAPLKREGDVDFWYDGRIDPGAGLDPEIRRALRRSSILLALVSSHYLASDYCFRREYQYALNRARRKTMRVVVALVGTCTWKQTRMAFFKCLPRDGKPVDQWGNRNKAYVDIAEGVRRVVGEVRKELKAAADQEAAARTTPKRKRAGTEAARPTSRRDGSKVGKKAAKASGTASALTKPALSKVARKPAPSSRSISASPPKKRSGVAILAKGKIATARRNKRPTSADPPR